jgi:hypothetical protein
MSLTPAAAALPSVIGGPGSDFTRGAAASVQLRQRGADRRVSMWVRVPELGEDAL